MKSLKDMVSLPEYVLHHHVAEPSDVVPLSVEERSDVEKQLQLIAEACAYGEPKRLELAAGNFVCRVNWANRKIAVVKLTWVDQWYVECHVPCKADAVEHVPRGNIISCALANLLVAEKQGQWVSDFRELKL